MNDSGKEKYMARNKYPEVTVEKILDVSKRLFIEKGFDNTTIQDIVDELGGLTKGAIYHHFKSKEEIMKALGDKMFFDNNPFDAVRQRSELNGLQKIREMLSLNQADTQRNQLNIQAIPILENPRILAAAIEANRKVLTPLWFELIDEAGGTVLYKPNTLKNCPNFYRLLISGCCRRSSPQRRRNFVKRIFLLWRCCPVWDYRLQTKPRDK
jgi:AcrR family transcriptional regulator